MARNDFRFMSDEEKQEMEATGELNNPSLDDEAFLQRYNANVNTPQRTLRTAASFRSETVSTHKGNAVDNALTEARRRASSELTSSNRSKNRVVAPIQGKKKAAAKPQKQQQQQQAQDLPETEHNLVDYLTGEPGVENAIRQQIKQREAKRTPEAIQNAKNYKIGDISRRIKSGDYDDDESLMRDIENASLDVDSTVGGKEGAEQIRSVARKGAYSTMGTAEALAAGTALAPHLGTAARAVAQGSKAAAQGVRTAASKAASKAGQAAKTVGNKAKQLYNSAKRANDAARGISTRKPLPTSGNQPLGNADVVTRMSNTKSNIPENLTEKFKNTFSKKARIPKKGLSKSQSKRFTDDTIIDELF